MKLIIKLILVTYLTKLISCGGHITVIGSTFLKQNGNYSVAITSRNFSSSDSPILEVAIHNQNGMWRMARNITLISEQNQRLEFNMKDQPIDNYNLSVNCIKGPIFIQSLMLNLITKNVSVVVQTDKAIYKPSDTVRFRVLILNENLKPLNVTNVQIYVTDAAQNRVKPSIGAVFTKGVLEGNLTLSNSPKLGTWHIVVYVYNKRETVQAFKVAEYTLPTFEIALNVNPHAIFDEERIIITLVTTHTFDRKAKGNATVTAAVDGNEVTKSMVVNGRNSVDFHIENELGLKEKNEDRTVQIFATFTEELTAKTHNATASVQVHAVPYKIFIKKKSKKFKPGLPFTMEALVQYHKNNVPISDDVNPVTFIVAFREAKICEYKEQKKGLGMNRRDISYVKVCSGGETSESMFEVYPSKGVSKIDIFIPESMVYLNVTVKYLQTEISGIEIPRASSGENHFLTITSKTDTPTLSENVKINIQSVKNFTEFSYHVLTMKGRVVVSDTIHVSSTKNHDFEFTPINDMEGEVKVIVFYVTDYGEVVHDSLHLDFVETRNFVDIHISDEEMYPNDDIKITISSNPNSFVGLLGIDQSVTILKAGSDTSLSSIHKMKENKTSKAEVFFIMHSGSKRFTDFSEDLWYQFCIDDFQGVQLFSVLFLDRTKDHESGSLYFMEEEDEMSSMIPESYEKRENFPETWLFEGVNFAINQTDVVITRSLPDTITSWTIHAFSINPITGFAETKSVKKFRVFKPLFISMDLRYSIKRNEVVDIPISVFNYMKKDQSTTITLHNENAEFVFIDADVQNLLNKTRTKALSVKSDSGNSTSFMIRALKIGSIKIKVVVTPQDLHLSDDDKIERYLLVKPEGITKFVNKEVFIDLRNSRKYTSYASIYIPYNPVTDSIKIEASIIGDVLGLPIERVNNLINLPDSSGDQNMIKFMTNIAVLDYLTAMNKLTPDTKNEVTKYLDIGYQKQMNYKHDDGSFSEWGPVDDESGSTWLTAFVANALRQAEKYIFVEPDIIEEALHFLSQTQSENGSFVEVGSISQNNILGRSSNGIALTAYTLITFLENKRFAETYNETIFKSLEYLRQNIENITDNYSLAVTTYALQLAHLDKKSLSKLAEKALKGGETLHWRKDDSEFYGNFDPLDIETTAYALHAFVEADSPAESEQIMKWLVSQRNEDGGFISTQDTVVGLQALSRFVANKSVPNTDMVVRVENNDNELIHFKLDKWNPLVPQRANISSSARDFKITAKGEGFSIFRISYQYNVDTIADHEKNKFHISRPLVNKTTDKSTFSLRVCANYNPDEKSEKSNITVMDVHFPKGCVFEKDFLKELKSSSKEIEVVEDHEEFVSIYFGHLSSVDVCPEFIFTKRVSGAKSQRGSVRVYDFFNIKSEAQRYYYLP